jgi:hypothetical protein
MNNVTLGNLHAHFGAAHERFADIYEGTKDEAVAEADDTGVTVRKNFDPMLAVVIVYNDILAVLRAVETLKRVSRKFRGQVRQRLRPVPVTQLLDPGSFDHLLADASSADVIIVSFNGPEDLPETLKKWIQNCLAQKRARESAIVALLNSNEQLDAPDSPRYQFLKKTARAAGLDFFAPSPDAVEEIRCLWQRKKSGGPKGHDREAKGRPIPAP